MSQHIFQGLSETPESHPLGTRIQFPLQRVYKWIQTIQQQSFSAEIQNMNSKSSRFPLVRQLRLFIDKGGLIRCGGRIHNAPVSELVKFPYLLPTQHSFTNIIVYAAHKNHLHARVNLTLTAIRQSYWIPSARQLIRRLLKHCVICRKTEGRPYQAPDPPLLVKCRVQETQPFEVTGVDFTGALYVKDIGKESKVYVCLLMCAVTRTVHLGIVTDLSTENFLQAFRRFSSHKSLPTIMISDNESTYLAPADELKELFSSKSLLRTCLEPERSDMEVYSQACTVVYGGFLGASHCINEGLHQEGTWKIIC